MYQETDWRGFFWSRVPDPESPCVDPDSRPQAPLAEQLLSAVGDLLFCPEFTVSYSRDKARDEVDELAGLASSELIWEKGVGFAQTTAQVPQQHHNRAELLRLIVTCFSQVQTRG